MKKRTRFLFALLSIALLFFSGGCDMDYLSGPSDSIPELIDAGTDGDALADFKQNGHYLRLYHLPQDTDKTHISAVRVTDGTSQVAVVESYDNILIEKDVSFSDGYIPLLAPDGGGFTRSGSFFVELSVQIDALTKITVLAKHQVLVEFAEGRGTLDLEKLIKGNPDVVDAQSDSEVESRIADIIASGGYIRFFNLTRTVSSSKISAVAVSNSSRTVARCADYATIAVRKNILDAEAFVPLSASNDIRFTETGSYFTTFTISVDALTTIRVDASLKALYDYTDGVAHIDITQVPQAPDPPPVAPHSLTVTGLPVTANPSNFVDILIHNSQGVVATCADYMQITVSPFAGGQAAVIPLVYDNIGSFNGQPFSDSGDFIVTFSFFPDAFYNIIVTTEYNLVVPFDAGSGVLDVSDIPPAPDTYLTITGLPANLQELNIADVFVWNQVGKIGKCRDYGKLIITGYGSTTTLRIPLAYTSADQAFLETGGYYVSFDLNVDALTRILIVQKDKFLTSFTGGNATLNANNLPQAAPPPYLTIVGLPRNTAKNNFSDVFLYNMVDKVARCTSNQEILITKNAVSATAMIPLVYNDNPDEYFRDSGDFIVTFTVNVDAYIQVVKTSADAFAAPFTDGSGLVDLTSDYGFFSGGLANPSDTSPPIIKSGTNFEMNGAYFTVDANTQVKPVLLDLPSTSAVYVYAVSLPGGVDFEYSTTAPAWVAAKNGWYAGENRALYKFVYVKDIVDLYAAKTFISDPWEKFSTAAISYPVVGNLSNPLVSLSGASNPAQQTRTLSPGAYVFVLSGAGGGGGGAINGSGDHNFYGGTGGEGGLLAEVVTIQDTTSFTLYTGSGGGGAGAISVGSFQGCGAGGGGSGTFAYSTDGYFGVAGGGGGGGGGGVWGSGGGGGAGGSVGKGGEGGKGGTNSGAGSIGGTGGGGTYTVNSNQSGYAGSAGSAPADYKGVNGESAGYSSYGFPDNWKNTNGANGQGGNGAPQEANGSGGGQGGNNRNAVRGGGAAGGAAGHPYDGPCSAGGKGGDGSILIYKIF